MEFYSGIRNPAFAYYASAGKPQPGILYTGADMQILALALVFVVSLFMPHSSVTVENPLVSGYMRQDNVSTISAIARLIRPSPAGLELLYHRSLGRMFAVSYGFMYRFTLIQLENEKAEYIWPNHLEPNEAGFYPYGRDVNGFCVIVTQSRTTWLYNSDKTYDFRAGFIFKTGENTVLNIAMVVSHFYVPVMSFDIAF
jgi:hypothetical protein